MKRLSALNWFGLVATILVIVYYVMYLPEAAIDRVPEQIRELTVDTPAGSRVETLREALVQRLVFASWVQIHLAQIVVGTLLLSVLIFSVNLWSISRRPSTPRDT